MSSGPEHKAFAAAICTAMHMVDPKDDVFVNRFGKVAAGAFVGYSAGSLPDWIEPALHPNHRKFFHSLFFAGVVGAGAYQVYKWEPADFWQSILRVAGLSICGAYLVHLAMDASTPKGLPFI